MAILYDHLVTLLRPAVEGLNYEFWGLEFIMSSRPPLLRLYIESENGVMVEDCETVSRQVSRLLDVEDPIRGGFTLEVSSPGLDRPLFYLMQYPAYCGEMISVQLKAPIDNQRRFKGKLLKVDGETIYLESDGKTQALAFGSIDKARLVPTF